MPEALTASLSVLHVVTRGRDRSVHDECDEQQKADHDHRRHGQEPLFQKTHDDRRVLRLDMKIVFGAARNWPNTPDAPNRSTAIPRVAAIAPVCACEASSPSR